jgi:hypothetical protein
LSIPFDAGCGAEVVHRNNLVEVAMGRLKFNTGDRIIGNDKKGSYWGRRGVIISYGPHKGEYLVHFDNGEDEYVNTEWLDRENPAE